MPLRQQIIDPRMNAGLMAALVRTISPARLAPYLRQAGHDEKAALELYLWNVKLGQSFHFPVQAIEVAVRNIIDDVFTQHIGGPWLEIDVASTFLDEKRIKNINEAKTRLASLDREITNDDLVASLSFGFWVSALAPRYYPTIWSKWLPYAFPNLPDDQTHRDVYGIANKILDLRNRIFHQEPLIGMDPMRLYSDSMKLLKWVCPETKEWVRGNCSVPVVVREKP